MNFRALLAITTLIISMSTLAAGQSTSPLSGIYTGDIAGTAATLQLERSGNSINGAIDAGGYGYRLSGSVNGNSGSGTLQDPQTGASMPFEIIEQGGAVTISISAADAQGQSQRINFQFSRGQGGTGPSAGAMNPGNQSAQTNVERDPALIGSWAYSDTYNSGDFSATTRLYMQIAADGSYAYGSGEVTAGTGSVYGGSGSGNTSYGQWRTEGGIVYIMETGSSQWVPYARYYVEGNSMMFTLNNGDRQVWQRR